MSFKSINPYNQEVLEEFSAESDREIAAKLDKASAAYRDWRKTDLQRRSDLFIRLGELLSSGRDRYARTMSLEMGKSIREARGEIEKCAWACKYYAEEGPGFLEPEDKPSDATYSYVRFDPIGAVLGIMPWNYPFWQVFRYAVPALMAGNVTLLKHAPNVPQVARQLEKLFLEAGFPEGVFQSLIIFVSDVADVIGSNIVQGVTLTGSGRAGSSVASIAGKKIKKTVLELGGSDPFIVLADADLEQAAETAVKARMQNAGQSCIAAKRLIVVEEIHDEFTTLIHRKIDALVQGDPLEEKTDVGPMARKDLAQELHRQLQESLDKGAILITGGSFEDCNVAPILVNHVGRGMPVVEEETFGPLGVILSVPDEQHAVARANDTLYGLGASIWSQDIDRAQQLTADIEAGAVFINGMVKSDPRLPFGGIKQSGYGRELSSYGIHEFVNIKTVVVQ